MTVLTSIELKMVPFTILTMKLLITLLEVCEIGISLHTSAKACVWDTNVYFT